MPNRIIKESICVSEQIDELSPFEETFFYRLLVNCDDYGCMDARVKVLAAKLYPLRNIRPSEIIKAVNELADIGLIAIYEVDEKPYLKVIKWSEHQRVRVSKHKYPEPTEEQIAESRGRLRQVAASCGEVQQDAADCGLNPIQSNPIRIQNPNPNPNPNPNTNSAHTSKKKIQENFDRFWTAYPKKVDKKAAFKEFEKLKPDEELMLTILKAVNAWMNTEDWHEEGGRFIPHPTTWLRNHRWEDSLPEPRKTEPKNAAPAKVVAAQQYEQRDYGDVDYDLMAEQAQMIEDAKRRGII